MAGLDDILTTQKNGVVAISGIFQSLAAMLGLQKGTVIPRTAATVATSTLYTVPTGYQFVLNDIEICNTSGTTGTFTVYIVPNGGTASAGNALFYSAPIKGNSTVQWTGNQPLSAGGTIQASASATSITFMINGGKA